MAEQWLDDDGEPRFTNRPICPECHQPCPTSINYRGLYYHAFCYEQKLKRDKEPRVEVHMELVNQKGQPECFCGYQYGNGDASLEIAARYVVNHVRMHNGG